MLTVRILYYSLSVSVCLSALGLHIVCFYCHFANKRVHYYSLEGLQANSRFTLYGPKNGLHAFYYNFAESEPIWMKFGKL